MRLKSYANPANLAAMDRFGIRTENTYGVSITILMTIAKEAGKDHELAQQLWDSGIHEARILAAMIDEPKMLSDEQLERWVMDIDSWDVCDQVFNRLFRHYPQVQRKAADWCARKEEFVKRAGFVLIAVLAVHDKKAEDKIFVSWLDIIQREASDERNFVKKSVNWALRQIGKRNRSLNQRAIQTAESIRALGGQTCRWIAADALRELTSRKVQDKLSRD
ncbi:MAG: DNA alkylation repair protein [Candidatus Omnitrophota bacterium]